MLLCGASYRQDVGDTRYSGSEIVVRKLTEMGAEMRVHDPYVDHWYEFEKQDVLSRAGPLLVAVLPQPGAPDEPARAEGPRHGAARASRRVILAVPHAPYLGLAPEDVVAWAGKPIAVVDCFGILSDDKIRRYFELGCEVKGLGRGHIQRIKEEVRSRRR